MSNKVSFEVEFDFEVWQSMNEEQRSLWVADVSNAINDIARVSRIKTEVAR